MKHLQGAGPCVKGSPSLTLFNAYTNPWKDVPHSFTSLFVHLPSNEPLGCFHILSVMSKAAINIYMQVFFFMYIYMQVFVWTEVLSFGVNVKEHDYWTIG